MLRGGALRGPVARPELPPADVALAAGFADQAHFTRKFKAAFGVPPARYRDLAA